MPTPPIAFHKVTVLPPQLVPHAVYFLRTATGMKIIVAEADGDPVDLEVSGMSRFEQVFPVSAQWIVNHNLGEKPAAIRLLTVGGVEFDAHIVHTSDNQFVVSLNPAIGGQVIVQ